MYGSLVYNNWLGNISFVFVSVQYVNDDDDDE
jgi:hypothetical protein